MRIRCKIRKFRPYRPNMKHQQDFIDWGEIKTNVACLMEMRLGKTLATIRLLRRWLEKERIGSYGMNYPFPCLIVAPVTVLEAWEKELKLEGENYIVVHGKSFDKRTDLAINGAFGGTGVTWVLINYESLRETPGLAFLPWYFVALDESTAIKNPKTKISELCTKGFRETKHRAILTGLVAPEGELDLFQQYKFLDGQFMGCNSYWEYRSQYFEVRWNGWQPKLGEKKKIKDYVHKRSFILTRQQANLGSKKIKETRFVKMTQEQALMYETAENNFETTLFNEKGKAFEVETDHVIVQRTWCARIAGGCDAKGNFRWFPKVTEIASVLKGELRDQPIIIGFRFNSEIPAMSQSLRKAGVPFEIVTGEDNRDERKRKFDWFRTSQIKGRVVLVQIKVAQFGIDLSVSDTIIFYSILYSTKDMAQFMDRIEHPNKKRALLYLFVATKDTIDEDAVDAVNGKIIDAKLFSSKFKHNFMTRRAKVKRKAV
jgi:SNF2 family DNA or RNA helicase